MINSKQLLHEFVSKLTMSDRDEALAVAELVLEKVFGIDRMEIQMQKQIDVNADKRDELGAIAERLNQNEPVQYILREADFLGRKFLVTPYVLIPRPETEELVLRVISLAENQKNSSPEILDIGTGSGCIPVTLALEIKDSKVYALDKSAEALNVAQKNAENHRAKVEFKEGDILTATAEKNKFDFVVSNPPYIPFEEKESMSVNVTAFEPEMALFVPDDDPLRFYKAISKYSAIALRPGGWVALEINMRFGIEVAALFSGEIFRNVQILKDISGKDRIVVAQKFK